jgi:plastocyanin
MNARISASTLVFLLVLALLRLAAYAVDAGGQDGTPPGPKRIEIKDFSFNPHTLTVHTGEKVTWVNRDEEPHTVVSVEKQFKKSSALDTDQEFTITAGEPGTYTYYCSVHPKMTGTIIVVKG